MFDARNALKPPSTLLATRRLCSPLDDLPLDRRGFLRPERSEDDLAEVEGGLTENTGGL